MLMKTSQKETRRCVTMMRNNLFVVLGKMKIATEGVEAGEEEEEEEGEEEEEEEGEEKRGRWRRKRGRRGGAVEE